MARSVEPPSTWKCIGITILGLTWARPLPPRPAAATKHAARGDEQDVDGSQLGQLLLRQKVPEITEVGDVDAVDLDAEDDVLAALGAPRAVVEGPHTGDEHVGGLVLAGPGEGQAGGDGARVGVVRVGVADRQQLHVVLARHEAGRGGQGSVMTVASRPLSRKQARPYQVISIGRPMIAGNARAPVSAQ